MEFLKRFPFRGCGCLCVSKSKSQVASAIAVTSQQCENSMTENKDKAVKEGGSAASEGAAVEGFIRGEVGHSGNSQKILLKRSPSRLSLIFFRLSIFFVISSVVLAFLMSAFWVQSDVLFVLIVFGNLFLAAVCYCFSQLFHAAVVAKGKTRNSATKRKSIRGGNIDIENNAPSSVLRNGVGSKGKGGERKLDRKKQSNDLVDECSSSDEHSSVSASECSNSDAQSALVDGFLSEILPDGAVRNGDQRIPDRIYTRVPVRLSGPDDWWLRYVSTTCGETSTDSVSEVSSATVSQKASHIDLSDSICI